jgi:hypothetical protein
MRGANREESRDRVERNVRVDFEPRRNSSDLMLAQLPQLLLPVGVGPRALGFTVRHHRLPWREPAVTRYALYDSAGGNMYVLLRHDLRLSARRVCYRVRSPSRASDVQRMEVNLS